MDCNGLVALSFFKDMNSLIRQGSNTLKVTINIFMLKKGFNLK